MFTDKLLVISIFRGNSSSMGFSATDDAFTISGPKEFSFTVPFDDIDDIWLEDEFSAGTCISGGTSGKYT